jgi:hypothetical protein
MRSTVRRFAAGLTIATAAAALSIGPATAAPIKAPNATPTAIDCGPGGTFDTVTIGNGQFTPAHDVNSNRILIPTSIGPTTFTVRDAEGNVVSEETDPTVNTKGHAAPRGRTLLHCTFTLSFPTEDGGTATVSGSASGFLSGRR